MEDFFIIIGGSLLVLLILLVIYLFLRKWFIGGCRSVDNRRLNKNRDNHYKNYQSRYSKNSFSKHPQQSSEKRESFEKGEAFENYLRERVFSRHNYTLVEKTHNYQTNQSDFVESTLKPDFKFRDIRTGYEFYVEAKWRHALMNNYLTWSNENQLNRYRSYAAQAPLYIVIGLGGEPSNPKYLYMEKLEKLSNHVLYSDDLKNMNFESQYQKYFLSRTPVAKREV